MLKPLDQLIDTTGLDDKQLVQAVSRFYWQSTKSIVAERIGHFQKQLGVKPRAIRNERTYEFWGKCSGGREITFNSLLSLLSPELIDYIVVHELYHIHHMNHDRSFWRRVGSIIPDYKNLDKQLESEGSGSF